MSKTSLTVLVNLVLTLALAVQSADADISAVVHAGSVESDRYENTFFHLTLTAEHADWQAPSFVNVEGRRARLVDALSRSLAWEDTYTFSILADSLLNHPQLESTTIYVRSVRHQLEKQGLQTIREEFPIDVSGTHFIGAILRENDRGRAHVRGMYSTLLNGYVLSLDVTASSEDRLRRLVTTMLEFTTKNGSQ